MIVNVCISVDDNYIDPALVMVNSLFINNKKYSNPPLCLIC